MMTTDLSPAFSAGHERGVASASWVEIPDVDSARRILEGFEDGDFEVLDLQPSPLSGEWAGESISELSAEYGLDLSDDAVADEFEAGFSDGFWAELQTRATAMLVEGVAQALGVETSDYFSVAQGLYWFAADYHGGQSSELYSILSTLGYEPAPSESGVENDETAAQVYAVLESGSVEPADVRRLVDFGYAAAH